MKKNNESWEIHNKKAWFDKSYHYKSTWIPMIIILGILLVLFLILTLICLGYSYSNNIQSKTLKTLCLTDGFIMLFLFTLYWVAANFFNTSLDTNKITETEIKKRAKKINLYFNITKIFLFLLIVLCGLGVLTAGYIIDNKPLSTVKAIIITVSVCYIVFSTISFSFYLMFYLKKSEILNDLIR